MLVLLPLRLREREPRTQVSVKRTTIRRVGLAVYPRSVLFSKVIP